MRGMLTRWAGNRRPGAASLCLALAVAAVLAMAPQATRADTYDRFVASYDQLLRAHVAPARRSGVTYNGVDYDGWSRDPRYGQARQLLLASTPPPGGKARLAYWINAYNFLTIDLIVRNGERRSIKNLGSLLQSPWKRRDWAIGGRSYSLDDIEHGIIRPMGDARIHFAVNCAAISCPDLRDEAYGAARLDAQLSSQVALTLGNTTKGMRADPAAKTVTLSKVMDWYGKDFARGDLKAWLAARAGVRIAPNTAIRFFDYDWSLNSR